MKKYILPALLSILVLCLSVGCKIGPGTRPSATDAPASLLPGATAEPMPGQTEEPTPEPEITRPPMTDYDPIPGYFALDKSALLYKLGNGFEIVPAGPEGTHSGYFFARTGLTFVFDDFGADPEMLLFIDCNPTFVLHGVHSGMDFFDIQLILGEGEWEQLESDTDWMTSYTLTFQMGEYYMEFVSFFPDGADAWLRLGRALLV